MSERLGGWVSRAGVGEGGLSAGGAKSSGNTRAVPRRDQTRADASRRQRVATAEAVQAPGPDALVAPACGVTNPLGRMLKYSVQAADCAHGGVILQRPERLDGHIFGRVGGCGHQRPPAATGKSL